MKHRETSLVARRNRFPSFGIRVALVIGALSLSNCRSRNTEPSRKESKKINILYTGSSEKLRTYRAIFSDAAKRITANNTYGEELYTFLGTSAVYAQFDDQGNVVVDAPFDDGQFIVLVSTQEERVRHGFVSEAEWMFNSAKRILFAPPPETCSDPWRGVRLSHETSHAHDIISGIELASPYSTLPDFVRGELRAYELERQLLDKITQGKFSAAIKRTIEDMGPIPQNGWIIPNTHTGSFISELDGMFPPTKSRGETSSRNGSYFWAINLILAELTGRGEEGKLEFGMRQFGGYNPSRHAAYETTTGQ